MPDSPFRGGYGASDEALLKRTGHPWEHWYRLLDAWGAAGQPHPAIARWLNVDQGVDGWWSQELTVRYEMAIGRRVPGQRPDGFEVSASRTFGVPVERLYNAVVDDAQRASWLGREIRLRTAKPPGATKTPASARFDWEVPSERVVMWFLAKGERSTLSLAHQRMPDAETAYATKLLWRDSLASLSRFLAG